MKQFKLTTNDNPFDPFEDFDNWFQFDVEKGYYSCSMLMRIAKLEDDFSEVETSIELERAIDEIVKYDFTDTYQKAEKEYPDIEGDELDDQTLDKLTNEALSNDIPSESTAV